MLQALLRDRFGLVVHEDTRPVPAFALTVGENKPKMTESNGSTVPGCEYQPATSGFQVNVCRNVTTVLVALLIAVPLSSRAQSPRPQFEVASVKPAKPDAPFPGTCRGKDYPVYPALATPPPLGTCLLRGVTLRQLIRIAYRPELLDGISDSDLVSGGPQWATSIRFDIDGKAASDEATTTKQLYTMLQALLSDRFGLRVHRATKEIPGYTLVVGKNGPKIKPNAESADTGSYLPTRRAQFEWEAKNIPLSAFANSLSGLLQAPVIDRTGLSGPYTLSR